MLQLAAAVTRTPVAVPDKLFKELRDQFSEREIVELNAAIAWENYRGVYD